MNTTRKRRSDAGRPRVLSAEHKAAMQEGRRRARAIRVVASPAKVAAYTAWLRANPESGVFDSDKDRSLAVRRWLSEIPEIPKDSDYLVT